MPNSPNANAPYGQFMVDQDVFAPKAWGQGGAVRGNDVLTIKSAARDYAVQIVTPDQMSDMIKPAGTAVLVCDAHVWDLHANKFKWSHTMPRLALPADEAIKSLDGLQRIWQFFADHKVDRHTTCYVLGGGTILDAAGLACALYKRGIGAVYLPTTLVSQADSSIGGKTAINWGQGKNQLGTVTPPHAVYICANLLRTLPDEHLRAGLCEVLRSALVGGQRCLSVYDANVDGALAYNDLAVSELIKMALSVKSCLVEADEHDTGPRMALNLGHTIGHAIEAASDFKILHGLAVGMGLAEETRRWSTDCIHTKVGERVNGMLAGTSTSDSFDEAAIGQDKKRKGDVIRQPILRDVGRIEINNIKATA